LEFLVALQRSINSGITADLSAFAATRNWVALLSVLPLGVLFGAAHAITPGHGKAVLATYLAGSRLAPLRGLLVAGVLSMTHIGSAVVLAVVAAPLVSRTLGTVGRAPTLENLSRGVLVVVGLWLTTRAMWRRSHHSQDDTREGILVGVVAGLIPCPLTLFTMFLALSRGVPEAGLTFSVAMMLGVGLTLSIVALVAVLARERLVGVLARHGASINRVARVLDASAGLVLVALAVRELVC
jgi:nickel/cobalt exporter